MRRLMIAGALALALGGCAQMGTVPASPAAVTATTTIDERLMLGAEATYSASALAALLALKSGALSEADVARVKAADATAFRALTVARAAFRAGRAADFGSAVAQMHAAVSDVLVIARGGAA